MLLTDKHTFFPHKALKRNAIKLTLLFLLVEFIVYWLISNHFDKVKPAYNPMNPNSSEGFSLDENLLFLIIPAFWIFSLAAARAYAIDRKSHATKRLSEDFPYAKNIIDLGKYDEFEAWFSSQNKQLKKYELNRLRLYLEFAKATKS